MLNTKKSITLTGQSTINGVIAEGYSATINSDNPTDMSISAYQQDKDLYKANRTICRTDRAEFEDAAYALQDEMLAALEAEAE